MRTMRSFVAAGCGLIVVLAIGCGPNPKDLQIESLQAEVDRLAGTNQSLENQLDQCRADRDQARGRALDLRQQLSMLQAEMRDRGDEATQRGRWTEVSEDIAFTDIADNILFASGKADLKSTGRTELRDVASELMQQYPGRQIWIVGHTDSDPIRKSKWKDNLELSLQRAATVFRAMQDLGIDATRMVAAGQGEYHPKAPNQPKTKHLNRRVQIIAVRMPETVSPLAPDQG